MDLKLQATSVDTKIIRKLFRSVLTSALIEATLERTAYVSADGELINNASLCSCRRTASDALVRDYVIWFLNYPYMSVSWINYRAMEIEISLKDREFSMIQITMRYKKIS